MISFFERLRMKPNSGFVRTWRVDETLCRALVSEHGEIISSVDCWKLTQDHPQMLSNEPTVDIKGYIHTPFVTCFDIKNKITKLSENHKDMEMFTISKKEVLC